MPEDRAVGIAVAREADAVLVGGERWREPSRKKTAPRASTGTTESIPAVRFVTPTGSAPIAEGEGLGGTGGGRNADALPGWSTTDPIRIGELMSPKTWIRKMLTE